MVAKENKIHIFSLDCWQSIEPGTWLFGVAYVDNSFPVVHYLADICKVEEIVEEYSHFNGESIDSFFIFLRNRFTIILKMECFYIEELRFQHAGYEDIYIQMLCGMRYFSNGRFHCSVAGELLDSMYYQPFTASAESYGIDIGLTKKDMQDFIYKSMIDSGEDPAECYRNHILADRFASEGKCKISVVIISRNNYGRTLRNCFSAFAKYQTYRNFEIVVISDDDAELTKRTCVRWSSVVPFGIKFFDLKKLGKAGMARTISSCCGEYLLLLNRLEWPEKHMLEYIVNKMDETRAEVLPFEGKLCVRRDVWLREQNNVAKDVASLA